jgi:hypothetical protein
VLVVVVAVRGVPAPVVHVVDVIAVRHGHMTTSLTVNVAVVLMYGVAVGFAFVVVIVVPPMKVPVVDVVDVVAVGDCDVAASLAVHVVVVNVFAVSCGGHCFAAVQPMFDS